ncbi:MAG: hypothetical protein WDZ28_05380, partial [Simkaniaceae bacterium]
MSSISNNEYINKFNELIDKNHDSYKWGDRVYYLNSHLCDLDKETAEFYDDRRFRHLFYFDHLEPTKENINYGDEWKLV